MSICKIDPIFCCFMQNSTKKTYMYIIHKYIHRAMKERLIRNPSGATVLVDADADAVLCKWELTFIWIRPLQQQQKKTRKEAEIIQCNRMLWSNCGIAPENALKMLWNCKNALKSFEIALKLLWKCSENALKLQKCSEKLWNWTETAPELHWNWTDI